VLGHGLRGVCAKDLIMHSQTGSHHSMVSSLGLQRLYGFEGVATVLSGSALKVATLGRVKPLTAKTYACNDHMNNQSHIQSYRMTIKVK
jgi:hypothetical protein